MNNKKAQITAFIILALVLLISVGLYFAVKELSIKDQPEVPKELTNNEVAIVQEFTTACLNQVTKKAIKVVGQSGGYTSIPSGLTVNPAQPYKSDVFENDIYSIPYWYYMKELNIFATNKPSLCSGSNDCGIIDFGDESIQENLEIYIEENLPSCLNNYIRFEDLFEITPKSEIKINIQIINDTVISRLNYELDITAYSSGDKVKMEYYHTQLDVPLLQMFVLATDITQVHIDGAPIENNLMNLIQLYSGMDSSLLPPLSEITLFDVNKKFWIRTEKEEQIRYGILPLIGLTRIVNTPGSDPAIAYVEPPYDIFAQGLYNGFQIDLGENKTYPYTSDIFYPDSEIEFWINDGKEIIKGQRFEGGNPFLTKMLSAVMTDYSSKYYISFPIIIKLHDDTAFNGEGYDFIFAVEANIRNNIPARGNMTVFRFSSPSRIAIDDPQVLVDKTIRIEAYDRHTNEPLPNANIFYHCGSEFFVGKTSMQYGKAVFEGNFPYCAVGGYIQIMKTDYASDIIYFNNVEDNNLPERTEAKLWPIQEKEIYVWKRTPADVANFSNDLAAKFTAKSEINESDSIMFNINRVNDLPEEDAIPLISFQLITKKNNSAEFEGINSQRDMIQDLYDSGEIDQAMYDDLIEGLDEYELEQQPFELAKDYSIKIIPGDYYIDAFIMTDGPFFIPEDTDEFCSGGVPILGACVGGEWEDIVYPEQNLSTWITGKANITRNIPEHYVYNDKALHFFVLSKPAPTTWNQLEDYDLDEYISDKEHMMDIYFE